MYSFETLFGFVPQRIPSLKDFQFHHDIFPDLTQFNEFIALNPQLRNLSTSVDTENLWTEFFFGESVTQNARNVNDRLMSIRITDKN